MASILSLSIQLMYLFHIWVRGFFSMIRCSSIVHTELDKPLWFQCDQTDASPQQSLVTLNPTLIPLQAWTIHAHRCNALHTPWFMYYGFDKINIDYVTQYTSPRFIQFNQYTTSFHLYKLNAENEKLIPIDLNRLSPTLIQSANWAPMLSKSGSTVLQSPAPRFIPKQGFELPSKHIQ